MLNLVCSTLCGETLGFLLDFSRLITHTAIVGPDYRLSFFFQAEDGIRDLVRSRGLGDVYKRQLLLGVGFLQLAIKPGAKARNRREGGEGFEIAKFLSLIHI